MMSQQTRTQKLKCMNMRRSEMHFETTTCTFEPQRAGLFYTQLSEFSKVVKCASLEI